MIVRETRDIEKIIVENKVNELMQDTFNNKDVRESIFALEEKVGDAPQIEMPVINYFADGIYAREITIPKGTVLTGKIHKTLHLNIISKGDISVVSEDGTKRIKAPYTFVSQPGAKRAGYAHEDTVWTSIHASKETDLDKLEAELIVESYDQLEAPVQYKQIEGEV